MRKPVQNPDCFFVLQDYIKPFFYLKPKMRILSLKKKKKLRVTQGRFFSVSFSLNLEYKKDVKIGASFEEEKKSCLTYFRKSNKKPTYFG
jgi:hypothetical protein